MKSFAASFLFFLRRDQGKVQFCCLVFMEGSPHVLEERVSLSHDALTGMEANLRFAVEETVATKVFGRWTAWQNWIFNRSNAVGEKGTLKLFGTGSRAEFDWKRV